MRWGMLVLLLALGGCDQPPEEFHSPFLLLRHNKSAADEQSDGGGIAATPVGDPDNPGRPVD